MKRQCAALPDETRGPLCCHFSEQRCIPNHTFWYAPPSPSCALSSITKIIAEQDEEKDSSSNEQKSCPTPSVSLKIRKRGTHGPYLRSLQVKRFGQDDDKQSTPQTVHSCLPLVQTSCCHGNDWRIFGAHSDSIENGCDSNFCSPLLHLITTLEKHWHNPWRACSGCCAYGVHSGNKTISMDPHNCKIRSMTTCKNWQLCATTSSNTTFDAVIYPPWWNLRPKLYWHNYKAPTVIK